VQDKEKRRPPSCELSELGSPSKFLGPVVTWATYWADQAGEEGKEPTILFQKPNFSLRAILNFKK
jgi:hypothetical protein